MKYGTYFAYWEHEWDSDFLPYTEKVARLGFDILEVAAGGIMSLDADGIGKLKNAAKSAGIDMTACLGLPKDLDVSSADDAVREKGIAYLYDLFQKLEDLDIHQLGGIIYAYWPYDYQIPFEKEKVREISITSLKKLAKRAAEHGVMLTPETVNRFEHFLLNDAEESVKYVQDVDEPNVKVMLDSFHMNIEEDHLGDAIRKAEGLLGHFHIGECNRKVPGKGHMPWDEMGKALRDIHYDGTVVMEPFVWPGGGVGSDIKVWRDLSDHGDEAKLDEDIRESLIFVREKFEQ